MQSQSLYNSCKLLLDKYINLRGFLDSEYPYTKTRGIYGTTLVGIKHQTLGKVAINILNKTNCSDDELHMLRTQIGLLIQIKHPNLVQVLELYEDDEYIYTVMELMEGWNVIKRIEQTCSFTESDAAKLIWTITTALQHLHHNGIIHGEVDLYRVLYQNTDATIKLGYRISSFLSNHRHNPLNIAIESPEFACGAVKSQQTDVWQLGIELFLLLCNYLPFQTEEGDIIEQLQFQSPDWDEISNEVKDLISRMLQPIPKDRITLDQVLEHPWIQNKIELLLPYVGILKQKRQSKYTKIVQYSQLNKWRNLYNLAK